MNKKIKMRNNQLGKTLSKETRRQISKNTSKPRKVINIVTGEIYNTIKDCAKINNIGYSSLSKYLKGIVKNYTNFIYYTK